MKNGPLAHVCAGARNSCITRLAHFDWFWRILAKICFAISIQGKLLALARIDQHHQWHIWTQKKWTHFFKPLCKIWRVQKKECKKTSLRGWASIPAWNPFSTENLFSETTFKDKLTIWLQILCLSLPSAKKMPELRNMGWSRTPNMQKFTNRMQVNPFANSILSTLVA